MTTFEDKLLGEKRDYYCSSSSEDENGSPDCDNEETKHNFHQAADYNSTTLTQWEGVSSNTGPKGVIRVGIKHFSKSTLHI